MTDDIEVSGHPLHDMEATPIIGPVESDDEKEKEKPTAAEPPLTESTTMLSVLEMSQKPGEDNALAFENKAIEPDEEQKAISPCSDPHVQMDDIGSNVVVNVNITPADKDDSTDAIVQVDVASAENGNSNVILVSDDASSMPAEPSEKASHYRLI